MPFLHQCHSPVLRPRPNLGGWFDILKPGGVAYVQSGNIRNRKRGRDLIIDETVEHIHRAAMDIVSTGRI